MKAKEQMFIFTERFRWFPHLWKSQIQPPDHSCAESKAKSGCSTPCSSELWATPRLELAQPPRCCGTLRDSILFLNTSHEKTHGKKDSKGRFSGYFNQIPTSPGAQACLVYGQTDRALSAICRKGLKSQELWTRPLSTRRPEKT